MDAVKEINSKRNIRVVSMPCTERFDNQDESYKEDVLGKTIPRMAVEASHEDWWKKYVGKKGRVVGMKTFGESAPGGVLQKHFGFDKESIIKVIDSII